MIVTQEIAEIAVDFIIEAVRCKTRIQQEQEAIEELRYIAKTELGVDPKDFNAYLATFSDAIRPTQ